MARQKCSSTGEMRLLTGSALAYCEFVSVLMTRHASKYDRMHEASMHRHQTPASQNVWELVC